MPKIYTMRDLTEYYGCTEYRCEKMLAKGILDPPLPRDSETETRIWSSAHVRRADERIRQLSTPAPVTTETIRISQKTRASIRSRGVPRRVF